jgi:DNA-directed RNA polymerase specialized sigma24 family protein
VSNREAAEIMGLSVKALESLLMRAKASLRNKLGGDKGREDADNGQR